MDLINKAIGSEANVDLSIVAGKVVLSVVSNHASGSVSLIVSEDAKYFLEKLKVLIPGTIDDYLIGLVEVALP